MPSSTRLRSTSRLLALEPRLLFDGGAVDQVQDMQHDAVDGDSSEAVERTPATAPDTFSQAVARANMRVADTDTAPNIKNTSDDGTVTVGEDDKQASNVLKDWQVTGNGQVTVTVRSLDWAH